MGDTVLAWFSAFAGRLLRSTVALASHSLACLVQVRLVADGQDEDKSSKCHHLCRESSEREVVAVLSGSS